MKRDGVGECFPYRPTLHVGRCRWNAREVLLRIGHGLDVPARQERPPRELLSIQEVHLAWIEARFGKRWFDVNEIRIGELLGSLPKPVESLLVQIRIVGEPKHYGARIR